MLSVSALPFHRTMPQSQILRRGSGGTCPTGCWPVSGGTCDCSYASGASALRGLRDTGKGSVAIGVLGFLAALVIGSAFLHLRHAGR